jgi:hypothetical protein
MKMNRFMALLTLSLALALSACGGGGGSGGHADKNQSASTGGSTDTTASGGNNGGESSGGNSSSNDGSSTSGQDSSSNSSDSSGNETASNCSDSFNVDTLTKNFPVPFDMTVFQDYQPVVYLNYMYKFNTSGKGGDLYSSYVAKVQNDKRFSPLELYHPGQTYTVANLNDDDKPTEDTSIVPTAQWLLQIEPNDYSFDNFIYKNSLWFTRSVMPVKLFDADLTKVYDFCPNYYSAWLSETYNITENSKTDRKTISDIITSYESKLVAAGFDCLEISPMFDNNNQPSRGHLVCVDKNAPSSLTWNTLGIGISLDIPASDAIKEKLKEMGFSCDTDSDCTIKQNFPFFEFHEEFSGIANSEFVNNININFAQERIRNF